MLLEATCILLGLVTIDDGTGFVEIAHSYGSTVERVGSFEAKIGEQVVKFNCKTTSKCEISEYQALDRDALIDVLVAARSYHYEQLDYTPFADLNITFHLQKPRLMRMPLIKKYLKAGGASTGNVTLSIPGEDNMEITIKPQNVAQGSGEAHLGSFKLKKEGSDYNFVLSVYNTVRDDVLKWDYYQSVNKEAKKNEACALYFTVEEPQCETYYYYSGARSTLQCKRVYVMVNRIAVESAAKKPTKEPMSGTQILGIIILAIVAFLIVCLPIQCARDNRREAPMNKPIILGFGVNNAIKVSDQNLKQMVNSALVGFFGKDIALEVAPQIKREQSRAIVYEQEWWKHKKIDDFDNLEAFGDGINLNKFGPRACISIDDYVLPPTQQCDSPRTDLANTAQEEYKSLQNEEAVSPGDEPKNAGGADTELQAKGASKMINSQLEGKDQYSQLAEMQQCMDQELKELGFSEHEEAAELETPEKQEEEAYNDGKENSDDWMATLPEDQPTDLLQQEQKGPEERYSAESDLEQPDSPAHDSEYQQEDEAKEG